MSEYMVLDVETVPIDYDDEALNQYIEEKDFVLGIHPMFAKLVCIGVKYPSTEPLIFAGDDEVKLLNDFWGLVQKGPPQKFVTYNGYHFDVPFLLVRSYVNGVKPYYRMNLNKWNMERSDHFDCMQYISVKGQVMYVGLAPACRVFGIPVPEDAVSGAKVEEYYEAGDWDAIKRHNSQDLYLTENLYLKLKKTF